MKNRLFIIGDSWVFWPFPNNHWSYYLDKFYKVYKFGDKGLNNSSIVENIGSLPDYEDGDRLIIVFTDPTRPLHTLSFFSNNTVYEDTLDKFRVQSFDLWTGKQSHYKNYREKNMNMTIDSEIAYYRKLKHLLVEYNPVFVTWSELFYSRCNDFVSLIKVSSLQEENPHHIHPFEPDNKYDGHPGPKGCYEFYKKIHKLLNISEDVSDFDDYSNDLI